MQDIIGKLAAAVGKYESEKVRKIVNNNKAWIKIISRGLAND